MRRLVFGAALAGGAALTLHRVVPTVREMHTHCREIMRTRCGGASVDRQPKSTPRCA